MTLFPRRVHEIGSEFWDVPLSANTNFDIPQNIGWYISGRAALSAIIKDIKHSRNFNRVALPSWCCDSMIKPFLDNGVEVIFYPVVYENGKLHRILDNIQETDVLYVMDYFGFSCFDDIGFNGIKICDITHSAFAGEQQKADYYFGSLRKWAGFYTGGFAYRKDGELEASRMETTEYSLLRREAMFAKKVYMEGKCESKQHLEMFSKAEELLDVSKESSADKDDVEKVALLDVEHIRNTRRENASFLLGALSELAIFPELALNDCPLFVPIMVANGRRDSLKRHLIDKKIYCPVHWSISKFHHLEGRTRALYEGELSIVCDQRYTLDDMQRIVREIKSII